MQTGFLVITAGWEVGKQFPLNSLTVFEAGRSQGHHVYIKEDSVAMSHFRLYRTDEEYTLHDLGSKKGTLVNGESVEKVNLAPGDVIQAGNVELKFHLVPEGEVPPTVEPGGEQGQGEKAAESANKVPGLVIIDGQDKGQRIPLTDRERFKIGRGLNADLKLTDGKVSREHCLLESVRDHHIIIDLESSNGTVVNGERVKKTVLKAGDYIRLGFTVLRYDNI